MKLVLLLSFLYGSANALTARRSFLRRLHDAPVDADSHAVARTQRDLSSCSVFIDAGAVGEDESPISGNVWLTQNMLPISNVPEMYDEQIFKSHRSGIAPFSYTLGGFTPGVPAEVTLGFAENYVDNCSKNNRVFNVTVNGAIFATNLDVYAVAGCQKALTMTGAYTADSNGQFVIEFTQVKHHPMVSLISIESIATEQADRGIDLETAAPDIPSQKPSDMPSAAPSDTPSSTPSDVPSDAPSDVPSDAPSSAPSDTPSSVPSDVPSSAPSDAPSSVPSDVPSSAPSDAPSSTPSSAPSGEVLVEESDRSVVDIPIVQAGSPMIFVDAGSVGEDETPLSGNVWLTQNMLPIGNVPGIYNETVFKSHRSGISPFSYTLGGFTAGEFAVVTLGFAENFVDNCSKGNRVFNVTINGEPFATELDVYAIAGCQKALVLAGTYVANEDGNFVIEFTQVKHHPMVSLITIEAFGSMVSDFPSGAPSDAPSSVPSDAPSSIPSDAPSSVPSDAPSSVPSDAPSSIPSDAPSSTPSDAPSSTPSLAPSSAPSIAPSSSPVWKGKNTNWKNENRDLTYMVVSVPAVEVPVVVVDAGTAAPATSDVFIDAGAADEDMSLISGNVWVTQNMLTITNVPSAYDESIFKSHRSGTAPFTYTIGGFTAGQSCDVTLGFAENFVDNCSKSNRVFTVTVNGQTFAENLDVYAVVGCQKALVMTKSYTADEAGQFVIDFTTVKHHPMISLIAIDAQQQENAISDVPSSSPSDMPSSIPSDVPSDAPSGTPSDAPSSVPSDAPSDLPSDAPSDVPSDAPSDAPSDTPSASPSVAFVAASAPVYIDAGSESEDVTIVTGNVWVSSNMKPIDNVPSAYDESIFQSHRSGTAPFSYNCSGFYPGERVDITLGFAENFVDNCNKGDRIFTVTVNGDPFVIDLDVYAVAGCQSALVMTKSFTADEAGQLVIVFIKVTHHPMVSLIEIDSLETRAPVAPPTTAAPIATAAPVAPISAAPIYTAAPVAPTTSAPAVQVNMMRDLPTVPPQAVPAPEPTTRWPTASPSAKPSSSPSWSPSAAPSWSPSSSPSASPSVTPTSTPSATPSSLPSYSPSSSPSDVPSDSPSAEPTASPSWDPSPSPSAQPSPKPTKIPTALPSTLSPTTATPTAMPSSAPIVVETEPPVAVVERAPPVAIAGETEPPVAVVVKIVPLTAAPTTDYPTSLPVALASNEPSAVPVASVAPLSPAPVTSAPTGTLEGASVPSTTAPVRPSYVVSTPVSPPILSPILPPVLSPVSPPVTMMAEVTAAPSASPIAAPSAILNLTLVKATTGADVMTLHGGDTVSLTAAGTDALSIRADTADSVTQVRFSCGGVVHMETTKPFVMAGKGGYDVYAAAPSLSQSGLVAVLVEAYDEAETLVDVSTISFTVVA